MTHSFLRTKKEIKKWLSDMEVEGYTLLADETYGFVVNVAYHVTLSSSKLTHIPVKFNYVNGSFHCHNNCLTSLLGAPVSVTGDFNCSSNQLTSLLGCPEFVYGFNCDKNYLTSLQHGPKVVKGGYSCDKNQLTTLAFSPTFIGGYFRCDGNQLTSLIYAPNNIHNFFSCSDNQIENLEYCPQKVGGDFHCDNNPGLGHIQEITDFKEIKKIHRQIVNIQKEKSLLNQAIAACNSSKINTHKI